MAPRDLAGETLLRHGRRVWCLLSAEAIPEDCRRALAAAALLHEIGRFLRDRGHHALRAGRWAAIHLDEVLDRPSSAERRLVGELILFHRHRGPLPGEISRPDIVDLFRRTEERDLSAGTEGRGAAEITEEWPRGPLASVLRGSDLQERLRQPFLAGRVRRIRRPDR